jgi:predicted TIM-barrel fold metal-dependent hydrolase
LPGFHIGADATMFGLDYPHFESIVPATMERVNGLAAHPSVTDDDMRKILFDNACDLFGFDRAMLQPHVDRVGFEIGALATTG